MSDTYTRKDLQQRLFAKYQRHGELEDLKAAQMLESDATKLDTLQADYATLLERWKEEQKMRVAAETRLVRAKRLLAASDGSDQFNAAVDKFLSEENAVWPAPDYDSVIAEDRAVEEHNG